MGEVWLFHILLKSPVPVFLQGQQARGGELLLHSGSLRLPNRPRSYPIACSRVPFRQWSWRCWSGRCHHHSEAASQGEVPAIRWRSPPTHSQTVFLPQTKHIISVMFQLNLHLGHETIITIVF